MAEISCQNCEAACCKGNPLLIMQLSAQEREFMEAGGNQFLVVSEPADHDRDDVIYPAGMQPNPEGTAFRWLVERGREFEPLPAGFGRYALIGACRYLRVDDNGWEYCGVYEQRPKVCQEFVVASQKCQLLRLLQGVGVPG